MPKVDPSVSLAERVDAACDKFEVDWRAGRKPRIEDIVAAAPSADRAALREALTAVEAELRGAISVTETVSAASSVRTTSQHGTPATLDHTPGDEPIPERVGRFEVRGVLGAGAFGRVYRAFDPTLGREVALKVPLARALVTPSDRDRFLREARAAATISHPNVCPIHEVGEHAGRPYIVMAFVPGQSLATLLSSRKEALPEKQAAIIVRKLAVALGAAHDKGIVHRDLKPANVMFDRDRKDVVVTDFGLARGPQLGEAGATQTGVIMGTPAYMSPEQARGGAKQVGPAADIFSLGVIMYELLAGRRPFSGTTTEVLGQILHIEPPPPSKFRPGLDPRLEALCKKAMAKDPTARFATMKEFAAAIDECQRASAQPATETPRATTTKKESGDGQSTEMRKLAELFDALTADRRTQADAAVDRAMARHRTPRWIFVALAMLLLGGVAAVAGIVFFTKTDSAKVTIELTGIDLSDPTLSYTLDGKGITAAELSKPIELKAGEHELVVYRGGKVVKRFQFTVTGGRNPRIEYREITDPDPGGGVPPKKDPDPKADPKVAAKAADETGFVSLFNGKDLTGWETDSKTDSFAVDLDGFLVAKGDTPNANNPRNWLITTKEFTNYVLRFDLQFVKPLPTHTQTGVAIRTVQGKGGPGNSKLEVRLRNDNTTPIKNGAVVYTTNDAVEPPMAVNLATGEWNQIEIEVRGTLVMVTMNGKLVNEVDLAKIDRTLLGKGERWAEADLDRKKGHIGLESWRSPVRFRNIRVKELP